MYKVQTLNKIAASGLAQLDLDKYEIASEITNPDAILVRSAKLHDLEFDSNLKAIGRAGAGVNNIPIDRCTDKGIVVFNTPGANANAVKELVIASMLISARNIAPALTWTQGLKPEADMVPKLVEEGKSQFKGSEIQGKKIGVIGLGAIGVMVANAAAGLGMEVIGYDPYISVDAAWGLSRDVTRAKSLEALLTESDFVTLHVPFNDKTKMLINEEKLAMFKKDAVLMNFARGGLVDNAALLDALGKQLKHYITDFPEEQLLGVEGVIAVPHLGASTAESENNCATMAARQLREFLENGNIKNSVNFPECSMPRTTKTRLVFANANIPNMIGQIATFLAKHMINITDMINKSKGQIAYNIIDVDGDVDDKDVQTLRETEGVIMVRVIRD